MKTGTEPKYYTPKAALDAIAGDRPLDAVLANPKFGELPDGVKLTPLAERHMSRPEAAYILAKLATSRRIDEDGVIALQMGAKALLKRHFDRQRNWARHRERAAEDSKRTTASAKHEQEAGACAK